MMGIHSRKLPVPRHLYNPSDIFSKLGLSLGRNLEEHHKIILGKKGPRIV